jgi:hypothetical protein
MSGLEHQAKRAYSTLIKGMFVMVYKAQEAAEGGNLGPRAI